MRIRDGQLLVDVAAAKGRCSVIGRIYDLYLDGWISKVIGSKQAMEFTSIFNELRTGDDRVTRALEEISHEAEYVSGWAIELIDQGQEAEALAAVRRFAAAYQLRIRELNRLLAFMVEQENEFLDQAKIV